MTWPLRARSPGHNEDFYKCCPCELWILKYLSQVPPDYTDGGRYTNWKIMSQAFILALLAVLFTLNYSSHWVDLPLDLQLGINIYLPPISHPIMDVMGYILQEQECNLWSTVTFFACMKISTPPPHCCSGVYLHPSVAFSLSEWVLIRSQWRNRPKRLK